MDMYNELPSYIQKYIYEQKWESFRDIQIQAFEEILKGNSNVVLTAGTASGKTEAAFLPALTSIYREPPTSIGILYISPLKALINDQFERLEKMLEIGNVSLCKWHGDVSLTNKKKMLENPTGVLQITVESLEMLISNKTEQCRYMFSDLRFIIIDEMHYFMESARGVQLLCIIERLQRIIHKVPLRIGLSATLGDIDVAKNGLVVEVSVIAV